MAKPPNIPDYPEALFAVELQIYAPNQVLLIWRGPNKSLYAKKTIFKFRFPEAANDN